MKKRRFRIHTGHLLVILSIVCVCTIALAVTDVVNFSPVRKVTSAVIVPFQKGINSIGTWMNDKKISFRDVQELSAEVEELKSQVNTLKEENAQLSMEQDELERLRALYEIDNDYAEYDKVAATVISRDPGNWYSYFVIDKGTKDGVEVDMNVISGGGLVGIVTETGGTWSTVRSIMDDTSNVSGMTVTGYDTCIVSGSLTLSDEGLLSFSQMNTDHNVLPGERIVTSNISDKYLKGIPIGTISYVADDSNNLTKTGYIIPAADLKNIQEVLVIKHLKARVTG